MEQRTIQRGDETEIEHYYLRCILFPKSDHYSQRLIQRRDGPEEASLNFWICRRRGTIDGPIRYVTCPLLSLSAIKED